MRIIRNIRAAIKFLLFAFALVVYFFASILITILSGFSFERARPHLTKVIAMTSWVGLKIIGIKVVQKFHRIDPLENYLIVSNHLSYLDIMVISRFFPSCFVTSKEMKDTFFLGHLCLLGGCIFVDRKNHKNLHREVKELTKALEDGLNIAIFPEAASTDGTSVIRFRRPLFQAAIDSHSKVLPICLNYRMIDSNPVTLKNRDIVFWYGDMSFLDHVLKLFSCKKIVVELNVLPSLMARDFADKNALADKCYELVNAQYDNIIA
ncbi:MAG: lysophospholipid acyltransferase family protein [Bacteriovorax sp.]|nr:lysophospholipid acyltransferase family protein [Bacteriovorax sp.]